MGLGTSDKFKSVQSGELAFWASFDGSLDRRWKNYDAIFSQYYREFNRVVDVGSGPKPYFLRNSFMCRDAIAVDPLMEKYRALPKYKGLSFRWALRTDEIADRWADAVFCLNMLDHAEYPEQVVRELWRIADDMLFLWVDIDKPTDGCHIHTFSEDMVVEMLDGYFDTVCSVTQKHWLLETNALWYVGKRK